MNRQEFLIMVVCIITGLCFITVFSGRDNSGSPQVEAIMRLTVRKADERKPPQPYIAEYCF